MGMLCKELGLIKNTRDNFGGDYRIVASDEVADAFQIPQRRGGSEQPSRLGKELRTHPGNFLYGGEIEEADNDIGQTSIVIAADGI
ncbi:MAG: hypothetical protein WBW81_15105 [Methylocella sp.]